MAQTSKTFRVFISSTFSDLKAERNALQERVFPRLRELAMAHGCHFQAIDLRWGVSEEAAANQKTMQICLGEIERCQAISPRPNFIILLGNRYGWRPLPYEIPALEYDLMVSFASEQDKSLLNRWYLRDDNAIPPVYVLQVRTGEYLDYDAYWHPVELQLHNILEMVARRANLPAATMVKYTASATEQEIRLGALELMGDRSHIFCYSRETCNIPQDVAGKDYLDFDQNTPDQQSSIRLGDLKADLKKVLGENYHEYSTAWEANAPSQEHIAQLCEHVYKNLETVILSEINQLIDISPLEHELNEQASFAAAWRADFFGRADYLERLTEYQVKPNAQPLLLVGASGTGKSALMAEAIRRLEESGSGTNILYRFIGATPSSSNPAFVIESICRQIYDLYDLERVKTNRLKEIVKTGRQADEQRRQIISEYVMTDRSSLEYYLRKHITGKPLILYIDALDQFSTIQGETPFSWLQELPELVHLVISSTPGSHIEALLGKLSSENVIEVKPLAVEDGETILDAWLSGRNRTLQAGQKKALLKGFSCCGLPLYLKMAFEEASQWRSYEEPPDLSTDLPGLIRQFFSHLANESNHGKYLVERSLAYLAAAKNGLAEDELLDILSHDTDVYRSFLLKMQHVPGDLAQAVIAYLGETNCAKYKVGDTSSAEAWYETKIKPDAEEFQRFLEYLSQMPDGPRLPVVLWSRLYFDLKPYLQQRDADRSLLFNYYHRLFKEIAEKDYLPGDQGISRHLDLARYFHQSPMRITREGRRTLNQRKMAELLHQQTLAKTWEDLEQNLTDLLFIEGMFEAGLGSLLIYEYNLLQKLGLLHSEPGQPGEIIVTPFINNERIAMYCPHCLGTSPVSPASIGNVMDCPQCGVKIKLNNACRNMPWEDQTSRQKHPANKVEPSPPFTQDLAEFAAFVEAEASHLASFPTMTIQQAINQPDSSLPARKARAYVEKGKAEFAWCEYLNKQQSASPILPGMEGDIHFSPNGKTWLRLDQGDILLHQAGSSDIATEIHTGDNPITAVGFSADGESILAGYESGELARIQIASSEVVFLDTRHDQAVRSLQTSWDGSRVLSCGQGGTVFLSMVNTGEKICEMIIQSEPIACSFSADEEQAIIIGKESGAWYFRLQDGTLIENIPGDESISAAAFSPDLQWLALASETSVGIWNLHTCKKVQEIPHLHRSIEACVFSPDGSFLIVAEASNCLSIFTTRQWKLIVQMDNENFHEAGPAAVRFSPDSHLLSCGTRLFDFARILSIHDLPADTQFFSAFTTSPLKYTLAGNEILAASTGVMGLLDSQSGKVLRYLPGINASCMALWGRDVLIAKGATLSFWSNDDQEIQKGDEFTDLESRISWIEAGVNSLLVVLEDSSVHLFSNDIKDPYELINVSNHLTAAAFSASDEILITASVDRKFQVWDTNENDLIKTLAEQEYTTRELLLCSDGLIGLAYGDDRKVHAWLTENGAEIGRTNILEEDLLALGYADESDQVIAITSKGFLYRWDARLEKPPILSRLSYDKLSGAVFSPRGDLCLFGTDTRELVFWNIVKNKFIRRIGKTPTCMASCRASEDGILVGYEDYSIQYFGWDGERGIFVGGFDRASDCDLTNDLMAVSSDGSGTIVVDQANGEIVATLPRATACAFSEDCRYLLTGNFDGLIQAWQLGDLQDWVLDRDRDDDEDKPPEVSDGIEFQPWSEEQVDSIACSPDETQIMASAGKDIRVISQADPDSSEEFPVSGYHCFYSLDGKYTIVVSGGDTQIFNTRTRRLFKRIPGGTHICGITRDNKWIINGDRADEICLWSVQAEKEVIRIFTEDWPLSLAISPIQDEFATAGVDGKFRIFRYHIPSFIEKSLQEERVIQKKEAKEAEESKERKAAVLLSSGLASLDQGKFDEAISTFQNMGRLAREIGEKENLWQAMYHESLAWYEKGDTTHALDQLKEVREIMGKDLIPDQVIKFIDLQANIYKAQNNFIGACQKYQAKEDLCVQWSNFPEAIQALLDHIDLVKNTAKWDELLGMNFRLEIYCRTSGDQSRLQACLGALADIYRSRAIKSFSEKALVYYDEQAQICRNLGEKKSLLTALMQSALIQQKNEKLDIALEKFQEAEQICRGTGKESELLTCMTNQGMIYQSKGDFQKALALHQECEAIARRSNDRENLLNAITRQAAAHKAMINMEAATQDYIEAIELARELGNMHVLGSVLSQLGSIYENIGELDKALTAFQEEETICKSLNQYEAQAVSMNNQASIYLKKKNRRMAMETAYAAMQLARMHKLKATEKEIQVFFRKI